MSAKVKIAAKLAADHEMNGLDSQAEWLLEHPKDLMLAMVWLDVGSIAVDIDSGDQVPTCRVRRIEPLGEVGQVSDAVVQLAGEAFEKRTGRRPIPMDIAEVTEERYSDTLPEDES